MGLPEGFPRDVIEEAARASRLDPERGDEHEDALEIDLLTIDPPESVDLDQAFHAERDGDGYRVHYAIADVGWFVSAGGALDAESRRRGQTLYSPDTRTRLYPPELERAASLLPGAVRPSLLWSFQVDPSGATARAEVRRALVRSRRRLTYQEAQASLDTGSPPESLMVLREVGELLRKRERERGGVSLNVPAQEVVREGDIFRLAFAAPLPVEGWNAQISLLTGMTAASLMLGAGVGLLRTLPPVPAGALVDLHRTAEALEVVWPEGVGYAAFLRSLEPHRPEHATLMAFATRLFRGGGYTVVTPQPADMEHHAIGAPYAHVTAPLRRLADRFANEVVLAVSAGRQPPGWALAALPDLPGLMAEADRRADELERRIVDYVEAAVLEPRVGETFRATVIESFHRGATVQLREPAVRGYCRGTGLSLGARLRVRLVEADPVKERVVFAPA
jgi:exoribonuclease R